MVSNQSHFIINWAYSMSNDKLPDLAFLIRSLNELGRDSLDIVLINCAILSNIERYLLKNKSISADAKYLHNSSPIRGLHSSPRHNCCIINLIDTVAIFIKSV